MKAVFIRYSVFVFLIGLFISTSAAQEVDASNYRMYFKFKTIKQPDNSRLLEVSFVGRNKKDRKVSIPVFDAEINFYNTLNDEEVLLGSSKTSKEGIAQLVVPKNQKYLIDEGGNINLKARFDGTDVLDEEESEIAIKNLFLDLNLAEIDSVKTVTVKAYLLDSIGNQIPVDEAYINIYIQGMLAKMKIKDGTIKNGKFEYAFATNIPGDSNGNITFLAMIEDSDDFGYVTQKNTIDWGVMNKRANDSEHKLWSKAGPIWMYVVLTFLLVGVWANYIYTIVNLFKIKRESTTTATIE